jgi:uncharacterized membrane protein (DUF2068 family)
VAIFEGVKGFFVLAVGLGLLSLLNRDLQVEGIRIVHFLHMNPAHRIPQIFLNAMTRVTNKNLIWLALGAAFYCALRFIEGYGLWYKRVWAEWFAIISGGAYLPLEVYELIHKFQWYKVAITIFNLAIVIYLLRTRLREHRRHVAAQNGVSTFPPE